jgi:hypothetical protein
MKHPSSRELFDYWTARRGRRPAPERGEIEPAAIRRALADTFILALDARRDYPFRIAGTRVCALFGRELKSESLIALGETQTREAMRELILAVTQESVGIVAGLTAATAAGERLDLEMLALPLSHHGRGDSRVIGVLAPTAVPYWLGERAVGGLRLGSFRFLSEGVARRPAPLALLPRGRLKHGLVVYDGGQA